MTLVQHPGTAAVGSVMASAGGSGFWTVVRNGNGAAVASNDLPYVGTALRYVGDTYTIWEGHIQLPCPYIGAQQRTVFSLIRSQDDYPFASNPDFPQGPQNWRYQWRWFSTDPGQATAFVAGDDFAGLHLLAEYPASVGVGVQAMGGDQLNAVIDANTSGNNIRFVVGSSDHAENIPPGEGSGRVMKMRRLYLKYNNATNFSYGTLAKSTLNGIVNAQTKLSDGREVFIDNAGTPTAPSLSLKVRDRLGTITTIGSLVIGSGAVQWNIPAAQNSITLCVDPQDNIYVVGRRGAARNHVLAQAFQKTGPSAWLAKGALPVILPAYDAGLNNFAADWQPVNNGMLVVACSHTMGATSVNQVMALTLKTQVLLGNESGAPEVSVVSFVNNSTDRLRRVAMNPSGCMLDVARLDDGGEGVIITASRDSENGQALPEAYRYSVSSTGTLVVGAAVKVGGWSTTLDPESRVLATRVPGSSNFIVQVGARVGLYNPSCTELAYGQFDLSTYGFMSPVLFTPRNNALHRWVIDSATRNLLRHTVPMNSTSGGTTTVATAAIPAGSVLVHAAIATKADDDRYALVRLAWYNSSAGTYGTVYVADQTMNEAPNAPQQAPEPTTINAAISNTLSWTFSDNNTKDTQTAYQVQIQNASTSAVAYDSGKVVSSTPSVIIPGGTLSNGVGYQWRVRTYDVADAEGAWSSYKALATTTTGIVAITSPANDNPPGLTSSSLTVVWSFTSGSGATQAQYQVKVVRTDTGATIYDTGFVTGSGVTSHQLTGLLSGVEQRIEVVVKDSGGNNSGTGTRLVTPQFSSPLVPVLTGSPVNSGGYVLLEVENPTAEGSSNPPPTLNRFYRRTAGGVWALLGQATPGNEFRDYTAGSGLVYEYQAEAVAPDGAASKSNVVTTSLAFDGIWLHDPVDPAATSQRFLFDEAGREETLDRSKTPQQFVGRAYPVYDFGDARVQELNTEVFLPERDPLWRANFDAARALPHKGSTVWYRDGLGRSFRAVVTAFTLTDLSNGNRFRATFSRTE